MNANWIFFVLIICSSCEERENRNSQYVDLKTDKKITIYHDGIIVRDLSDSSYYYEELYEDSMLTQVRQYSPLIKNDTLSLLYSISERNFDQASIDGYKKELQFSENEKFGSNWRVLISNNFSKSNGHGKTIEVIQEYFKGDSSLIQNEFELIANIYPLAKNYIIPYNLYKRVKYSKAFGIGHGYCKMKYFDNRVVILEYFVNGNCNIVKNQRFRVDDPDFSCPKILTDEYSFTAAEENVFVTKKSLKTDFQEIDTIAIWEKQVLSK